MVLPVTATTFTLDSGSLVAIQIWFRSILIAVMARPLAGNVFARCFLLVTLAAAGCTSRQRPAPIPDGSGASGAGASGGGSGGGSAGTGGAPSGGDIPTFVLYDLGDSPQSPTYGLHVDADGVYWFQRDGGLYRGSRDGRKPVEHWSQLKVIYAGTMISDAERLYWIAEDKLAWKAKISGEEGDVKLSWNHSGGGLAIDDGYVYVAMIGCPAITRVDRKTLVAEEMYIPDIPVDPNGGGSRIIAANGGLYCGSWSNVFWISGWNQPAKKLVATARRVWALAQVGDNVYWLNNPGSSTTHLTSIGRVAISTGVVTEFPEEPVAGASNFIVSPDAKWLFHSTTATLYAFSIEAPNYVPVLPPDFTGRRLAFYGRNIASDGEALYYLGQRETDAGRVSAVHKVPFSFLADRLAK
jgi:hypothetical protein